MPDHVSKPPIRWPDDKLRHPFSSRREPQTPPATGIFDSPGACVMVNFEWLSHLLGALDTLTQPDAWLGTDSQIFVAQQEIEKLIAALTILCVEDAMPLRQNPANACEMQQLVAEEWVTIFDFELCAVPGPPGETGAPGADSTVPGPPGETGAPGADSTVPGPPGIQGIPGIDGEDCDCGITPPQPDPDVEESDDVRCGTSSYMATFIYSHFTDMLDQVDAATTLAAAVTGWLAIIPFIASVSEVVEWAAEIEHATTSATRAEVTTEFSEELLCTLYCLMPDTAVVDQALIDAWAAEVETLSPIAGPELAHLIRILDVNEWRKRAIIGASTPSEFCAALCACGDDGTWCYEFNFRVSDGGFANLESATWSLGAGWIGNFFSSSSRNHLYVGRTMTPDTSVNEISITYTKTGGSGGNEGVGLRLGLDAGLVEQHYGGGNGSPTSFSAEFSHVGDTLLIDLNSGDITATVQLHSLRVTGAGPNPFGEDNCT